MKKYISLVGINISIFSFLFFVLEITFRATSPELADKYHTELVTGGKKTHQILLNGILHKRTKRFSELQKNENNKIINNFLVLGDSVSQGYSLAYEDIYWVKMQNKNNLFRDEKLNFVAITDYGAYEENALKNFDKYIKTIDKNKLKYVLYQFNLNDIIPSKTKDTLEINQFENSSLFKNFLVGSLKISYAYLSRSAFLRRVYIFANNLSISRGTCEEKGIEALGQYTWSYGSKKFVDESEKAWQLFEKNIFHLSKAAKSNNTKFMVFITPNLYEIDKFKKHPYYNFSKLDFSCATIDPRKRMKEIGRLKNIKIIDPTEYVRKKFEDRIQDGNFEPFFLPGDDNHFNNLMSEYLSDYLYQEVFNNYL